MTSCARPHRHPDRAERKAAVLMSEDSGRVAPVALCIDCAADYARGAVADTWRDHIDGGQLVRTVTIAPVDEAQADGPESGSRPVTVP